MDSTPVDKHPPPSSRPGRRDHLTFRGNVSSGRHGWLRLTPAYSLHVVRDLLRECGHGDLVLDPFSGTGTTPLAAASAGIRCHAIDINSFLVWLGNLKLRVFEPEVPSRLVAEAEEVVADRGANWSGPPWAPPLHAIDKWWDADVLARLAELWGAISARHSDASQMRDLLSIAFSRVLIQTANVSFGHQSMSFKAKRAHRQTRLFDGRDVVATAFLDATGEVAQTLHCEQPLVDARVVHGDSRQVGFVVPQRAYTRVITSPPYPNRMSYIRELRPYMYWLGYLTTGRQAGELDWNAIGGTWGCATSLLNAWNSDAMKPIPHPGFDDIVADITRKHDILGRYVHRYFQDTLDHVESLTEVLARGAECFYVVGNSKFYDTVLPTEQIYASIFKSAGFTDVQISTLRKRTSKKELFEFVVRSRRP